MSASTDFAALLDQYMVDQVAAATNPLRATIGDLTQQLADRDATITARNDLIGALQQRITDLEAQIAAQRPTPDVTPATLFGASVPELADVTTERQRGYATFRKFFTSLPAKWNDNATLATAKPGDTWIISHKTSTDDQVATFLATVPDAVQVWMCKHHEPENDNVDKPAYRAAQASHARTVRAAGHKSCLILMGYTSEAASGRDYRDWYSPEVDAIFWDAYNSGNKKTPPVYETPDHILAGILSIAKETGKPWGITETGAKVNTTASNGFTNRPEWAAAFAQTLKDNGALVATWWDQITGTFDVRLDDATAAAWR